MFSFFKKRKDNQNLRNLQDISDAIAELSKSIDTFAEFVDIQTRITQDHHKTIKTILDTIDVQQKSINLNDDNIKLLAQAVSAYFKEAKSYDGGNEDDSLVIKKTNKSN